MENQQHIDFEYDDSVLEQLAQKQDYLDYIDADMEAFYSIKTDQIAPEL